MTYNGNESPLFGKALWCRNQTFLTSSSLTPKRNEYNKANILTLLKWQTIKRLLWGFKQNFSPCCLQRSRTSASEGAAVAHSVTKSCLTLFMSPWTVAHQAPLSMGFFLAKILEWVAISFSRSSWTRNQTHVSCIGKRILYHWDTWEAPCFWNLHLWQETRKTFPIINCSM